MKKITDLYHQRLQKVEDFIKDKILGLFIFNIILMMLILMRSAGYFSPFFPLSINFIILICLIISIPLLGVREKALFFISLLTWIFAGVLRILKVDVWAERTTVYSFEALVIGMIILLIAVITASPKPWALRPGIKAKPGFKIPRHEVAKRLKA